MEENKTVQLKILNERTKKAAITNQNGKLKNCPKRLAIQKLCSHSSSSIRSNLSRL